MEILIVDCIGSLLRHSHLSYSLMQRIRAIEHEGQRVVLLDFTGIDDPAVGLPIIDEARRFIAAEKPDGTMRTLTDVSNTRYDRQIIEALKELTVHNRPYVGAAAVVTQSAMHRAMIRLVALFAKRHLEVFETRQQALDWLTSRPLSPMVPIA